VPTLTPSPLRVVLRLSFLIFRVELFFGAQPTLFNSGDCLLPCLSTVRFGTKSIPFRLQADDLFGDEGPYCFTWSAFRNLAKYLHLENVRRPSSSLPPAPRFFAATRFFSIQKAPLEMVQLSFPHLVFPTFQRNQAFLSPGSSSAGLLAVFDALKGAHSRDSAMNAIFP